MCKIEKRVLTLCQDHRLHTQYSHSDYQYFLLPALKDVKVFGSYSKTNVYKLFVDLFPSATHLICDLHMKDSVQSKLSYLNFNITAKDEVMCDVFRKRLFDHMVVEIKKKMDEV